MHGTLAREHVSMQGMLVREHLSTQDTLAHEHVSTQDMLTREHVSTQETLAREAREHVWSKYTNNQTMKITGSSSIHKTICHNGCYLLLFRRRQQESFEFSCE